MNRKDFLATLPKKRVASGALFFDKNNAILMVKPTYKTTWEIVGGVVESNESPMNACIRETKEEIGLSISTLTLLCLEYQVTEYDDSFMFIFNGGVLSPETIAQLHIDEQEISEYRFIPLVEIINFASDRLSNRIQMAIKALENNNIVYFESYNSEKN
jgi:8-oxo-dGTP diphosphatase